MARPTKYTPEIVKLITDALGVGSARVHACWYAGINQSTFETWMKRYPDFAEAVEKAEGRAVVKWQAVIEKAAAETWQAAAWKLERRYPREYGRNVVEQQHSGGVTIKVQYSDDSSPADDNG